jgi:hypothetical protein
MSTRLQQRRARLRAEYGFDFPEDFYAFWEFANRLSPLDPLHALADPLNVTLVGPFEVLAGRFDGRVPRHSLLLHWRYYDDPPEFFTVLSGHTDGLHFGYFLDEPDRGGGCVAHYYARDAYEFTVDGDTLFEAARLELELSCRDWEEYRDDDPENADEYDTDLEKAAALRRRLTEYATGDRPETGDEYAELYLGDSSRNDRVVAETMEGMGVVAPAGLYRPLSLPDERLWRLLRRKGTDPAGVVEEARRALRDGFPATALKLGKDLWATTGARKAEYAYELLDAAYQALGRETPRRVLQTHRANRDLPSVDILDDEAPEGGE